MLIYMIEHLSNNSATNKGQNDFDENFIYSDAQLTQLKGDDFQVRGFDNKGRFHFDENFIYSDAQLRQLKGRE